MKGSKLLLVMALVLVYGCQSDSGGSSKSSAPPGVCEDVLLSELTGPDWLFISGQPDAPETLWACEIDVWFEADGLHMTHKFCCFLMPEHPEADASGHLSVIYYFREDATGWWMMAGEVGEATCDMDCPSQVEL